MKKNSIEIGNFFSARDLVSITGVNINTARRWISGKQNIHPAYSILITLYIERRIIPESARLVAHKGHIQPRDTDDPAARVSFAELRANYHTARYNALLKQQNKQLKKLVDKLQSKAQEIAAHDTIAPAYKVTKI